jgi:hypothetical protein
MPSEFTASSMPGGCARRLVLADGFGEAAARFQDLGEVQVEGGVVGIHLEAAPEHLDGVVVPVELVEDGAQGVVGQGLLGVQLDAFLVGLARFLQALRLAVAVPQVVAEVGAVRGQGYSLLRALRASSGSPLMRYTMPSWRRASTFSGS